MSKTYKKLAVVLTALSLAVIPLESAGALSVSGSSYSSSASAYQDKWMPYSGSTGSSGSAYEDNLSKLKEGFGIGNSGSTNNQVPVGGASSGSTNNQVPVGGVSSGSTGSSVPVDNKVNLGRGNYGSSAMPGGYQYNPAVSNKVAVSAGSSSVPVDNKVSQGGGNYGSSAMPGGYQYNPAVSNKVAVSAGSSSVPVDNKVSHGGGNYGSSAIPGGYQYNPAVSNKVAYANKNYGSVNNKVPYATENYGSVNNKVPYAPENYGSVNNKVPYAPANYGSVNNKVAYATENYPNVNNKVSYATENFNRPENTEPATPDYPENEPVQTKKISLCQNRPYPRDIDGHWSEIYVRRLYDLCVVEGYEDGNFRPNANVTRAELVKMGLFANGIEPNRGCYDNDCGSPFNDLDSWQGRWVRPAYDRGIIEGYLYDSFRPNQAITRAEAVKVVLATYGYSPTNDTKSFFNDVHGWSVGWVERARIIGLVQGIGNGNFDPDRPITRAEAAKIVAKMIEYWDTSVARDNANRAN